MLFKQGIMVITKSSLVYPDCHPLGVREGGKIDTFNSVNPSFYISR